MASNARMLALRVINSSGEIFNFDAIDNGGGLYSAPIRDLECTGVISPGERKDIIIDFSQFSVGTKLYLEDAVEQEDGRSSGGDFDDPDLRDVGQGTKVLEFRVVPSTGPDNSQVPNVLRPLTAVPQSELDAATRREFVFERGNGAWQVNDEFVDIDTPWPTFRSTRPRSEP